VIYVGLDDTDTLDSPGTNQLARRLVERVSPWYRCRLIVRHQLLADPRVPFTSKNGSASITLVPIKLDSRERLIGELRAEMRQWYVEGSDPGLCVTESVPAEISEFGRRCQQQIVRQREARDLAQARDIHLEGLGGTEGGVIGALAAVGLAATGDDGRVVQIGGWPDDLSGIQTIATLGERGVEVRRLETNVAVTSGNVDVGKHLRPNCRAGRLVLYAQEAEDCWQAVRLT
jgi:tRNA(Ile2) C34 agmatinyltransferase TiaS